jgi:PAS domain S-box-containing protein
MKKQTKGSPANNSAEDALKKSEEKYHMLLNLAVDAIFQGDTAGNFILVNDRAIELTGYSAKELLTMNIKDLFQEKSLTQNPLRYDLLSQWQTVKIEREIVRKDGTVAFVEMTSKAMPDGTYQSIFRDVTEARKAENALIASELKYRNLHSSMMDGYVYCDMQGRIRDSNGAYQRMLGYTENELAALTYGDITPARWHDFEDTIIREEILPVGHSRVYQKEYLKKDGTLFPVELRTFLIRGAAGENEGMWAFVRDITKRKEAEEAIRKSEEKFRSIVESSPSGMHFYNLDNDNNLILNGANPSADFMLGISHSGLIGKTIFEAFPNLRDTSIPDIYTKVATGETGPQSFEIPYQDERFSGYYAVHVFRTGLLSLAVNFTDITQRRETEAALVRSEIEYRDTLDSLPDWIYVVDEQYKIAMVNVALKEELIRYGMKPDCIGLEILPDFPFISNNTLDEIKQVFITGIVSVSEQKIELKGKSLHGEITRVPILKDGKVVKVILMIRDRSKENEIDELKRRNAEQKEVMLREIHHRVKNNLAIVISLLNFQLRNNTNEELNRMIIDIQMRIRSMALIHEHLYRSENLDRIPLAIYIESLAHMIMTAFSGHHVTMVKDLETMDVSIETALPIGLVINELLTNAFKYAFPGGANGEIRLKLKREKDDLCSLVVEDNGVGLPVSSSMDSEKSLGLYIVRLLVEQLDGTVNIVRQNGTSFQITFLNLMHKKPGRM